MIVALFGKKNPPDPGGSDRDDNEPNWCGACQMHYSTWANHSQLYRHNHQTDTTADGMPDTPPDQ